MADDAMKQGTVKKIKLSIRISHDKLDDDVRSEIDACLADLQIAGILKTDESDALIFNAIKLWCKSTDAADKGDVARSEMWHERYEKFKACLMMAEGYGYPAEEDEANE